MKLYSSGMFARVAFASAIHVNPEVLVVDEILGVGDAKFQEKCYSRIRSMCEKGVCILLSATAPRPSSATAIRRYYSTAGEFLPMIPWTRSLRLIMTFLYGSGQVEGPEVNKLVPGQKRMMHIESHNPATDVDFKRFLDGTHGPVCERFPYYNSHERRFGNGDAKIVDLIVAADGQLDFGVLSGGESLMIYLKVHFTRAAAAPQVGWALVSPEGIIISGSNSLSRNRVLPATRAGETWVYAISMQTGLCGGEFLLALGSAHLMVKAGRFLIIDDR